MSQRRIVVLARNTAEANVYARRAGLPRFTYTCPGNSSLTKRMRNVDIHVLPGFKRRPDRHSILASLRYGAGNVFYDVEMPEKKETPAVDQGDGMGEQLSLEDLMALNADVGRKHDVAEYQKIIDDATEKIADELDIPLEILKPQITSSEAFQQQQRVIETFFDEPTDSQIEAFEKELLGGEETGTSEPSEDSAPDSAPRRRRSRCPDCDELTFEPHDHGVPVTQQAPAAPVIRNGGFD